MSGCRWLVLLAAGVLLALAMLDGSSASPDGSMPSRPTRPEKFSSEQEIKEYVRKLQEYYSIIGRGRFGKRDFYVPDLVRRYLPPPNRRPYDLYDLFAQYE